MDPCLCASRMGVGRDAAPAKIESTMRAEMMKTMTALPMLVFCAFAPAQDLPPDVLFDQYRLEAAAAVEKGDNKRTLKAFAKIEALGMELPAELAYFYGRALVEQGAEAKDLKKLEKGQSLLEQFVTRAGKDSEHYKSALKLLARAESNMGAAREKAARDKALQACEASWYLVVDHQSVVEACQAPASAGVARAKSVIDRSAKRAAREKAEREKAGRIVRELGGAGALLRDCAQCPEMVVVPAGTFIMGSPAGEKDRFEWEGPQHRVRIGRPFAAGKYEVTFAEWDACVAAGGCGGHHPGDEGWGRGKRPVINVSWDDAQAYVKWLSDKSGKSYRLLSESEWEYAARAGTTGAFSFGAAISASWANYDGNYAYGSGGMGVHRKKTVAVGSFPANKFGLHDMHGNVLEWVADCWNEDYAGAPNDGRAWKRGDCNRRVLRGGSWSSLPGILRSAFRLQIDTVVRNNNFGFRVARTL